MSDPIALRGRVVEKAGDRRKVVVELCNSSWLKLSDGLRSYFIAPHQRLTFARDDG